ncbi:MAG: hypothetical protein WC773_02845 [Patescibacteria group bacterium]|jgi:hypothetical protein
MTDTILSLGQVVQVDVRGKGRRGHIQTLQPDKCIVWLDKDPDIGDEPVKQRAVELPLTSEAIRPYA